METEQLLHYAAKAAKISYPKQFVDGGRIWNPLEDDGDSFRLAAFLGLEIKFYIYETTAEARVDIVRRAAYIGRHM